MSLEDLNLSAHACRRRFSGARLATPDERYGSEPQDAARVQVSKDLHACLVISGLAQGGRLSSALLRVRCERRKRPGRRIGDQRGAHVGSNRTLPRLHPELFPCSKPRLMGSVGVVLCHERADRLLRWYNDLDVAGALHLLICGVIIPRRSVWPHVVLRRSRQDWLGGIVDPRNPSAFSSRLGFPGLRRFRFERTDAFLRLFD